MAYGFKGSKQGVMAHLVHPETGRSRLLRPADIAELLGVKRNTVNIWKVHGQLPPPDLAVTADSGRSTGDQWLVDTILDWARNVHPDRYDHALETMSA